jgi:hypothetical protein
MHLASRNSRNAALLIAAAIGLFAQPSRAQDEKKAPDGSKLTAPSDASNKAPSPKDADAAAARIPTSVTRGVELLLSMQESLEKDAGDAKASKEADQDLIAEWPYEGVYRAAGQIPIGYRVGGTAISAMALLRAPDYAQDNARKERIRRAARFIVASINHPLMNPDYDGGYDVRGWGYTYGLALLLRLKAEHAVPDGMESATDDTIKWFIHALEQTEIPKAGGWNYARPAGKEKAAPPSPFMTGPSLQALFQARSQGFDVNPEVVGRAVAALERARTTTGSFVYAGDAKPDNPEAVPGSVGRMLVSETTLYLCGKSTIANIRGAVDAFIVHWEWLDKRRAQNGTHIKPYMIAPYYFYYAHYYAAQAVEMLPEKERAEYRRKINNLLFSVQLEDGSWNDRVFPRSKNYGTAMAMMALMMPDSPPPAPWKP